jgi:hypothetical protein
MQDTNPDITTSTDWCCYLADSVSLRKAVTVIAIKAQQSVLPSLCPSHYYCRQNYNRSTFLRILKRFLITRNVTVFLSNPRRNDHDHEVWSTKQRSNYRHFMSVYNSLDGSFDYNLFLSLIRWERRCMWHALQNKQLLTNFSSENLQARPLGWPTPRW